MPTATPINDSTKRPWTLVETTNGWRGKKYFRIDTDNLEMAHQADGLPRKGEPWSSTRTDIRVVSIDPRPERAGGPWMIAEIIYENDVGQVPEADLVTTTKIVQSSTTATISYDLNKVDITTKNRGVSKLLTVILFEVTQYFEQMPDLLPYRLLTDEPKVNENSVVLNNIMGSGQTMQVAEQELLYAGFTVDRVGDVFAIVSTLQWRRDWKVIKPKVNAAGEIIGDDSFTTHEIYELGNFGSVL